MKNILIPCLALAVAAFGLPSMAQDAQPLDGIAAVVNEDVILESELDRATANIVAQYGDRPGQLPPAEVLRRQLLERLILVRLQTARAQETGVRVTDEEVDAAIGGIAQQNSMTPDQLRQQLARDGLNFADFRRSLGEELMIQRMRQRFAQTRVTVTEGEVDAALANQATGTQYRLAHILVALPSGATPEQIATAQQKADGVKSLLDRGEMDFQAAAVRYSDSPNALEGGDLGWRSTDEIPTAFTGSISTMQPGQVLGPFRGPSGFQLLQLMETRDASAAATQTVTQYQARHVLVRGDDAAAKARIDTLRARIAGGADFATVAREDSQDRFSGDKGGDLGWFVQDQFGPEFGAQIGGLADGEVSAPFRTQAGWHVVQRQATRQANVGDENRRAQVRETIGQRKLEDEWNRYLRELRGEAYVDIRSAAGVAGANGD
ncbi:MULTISPECIES: peptidylprolyl isomerase [unclassified Luteimonas]|uniref:peptidylprolyl isomerase n=1 Tax=unclassified Luteimonas TaxID=2629088 RepID=UPI001600ABBF|nr:MULTISPECIES: peptidylprolyl isomerase [unclassified Luteimonas]MBB1473873.1 peptidylprolyl isomerase [Luteimonas sp. MC1782]MBB6599896.1 peptidylprolyl isomerase [Luteimonas sp. MC1825]QOC87608.1 peptidylprolyl isomerase [Luteimonas sp. MC1825]